MRGTSVAPTTTTTHPHPHPSIHFSCSGVVPNFSSDTSKPIDLRGLPPAVASAYACMVVSVPPGYLADS